MRYRIAYDEPGRLRVRFGPDAFTQEQGYGIALLLGRPGVREAVTCALNGSVLVCYEGEGRAEALAVLRGLRRDALPVGTAADDDQLRQVDSQFLGRLLSMAARHFLKKWFLPFPVRCAVTLWNAAGYWREGLRSLGGGRLDVAVLDAASIPTETVSDAQPVPPDPKVRALTDEELVFLNIGGFKLKSRSGVVGDSGSAIPGTAGETASCLADKGIPALIMADGPAGLRLARDYYEDKTGAHSLSSAMLPTMIDLLPGPARAAMRRPKKLPKGAEIKHRYATAIPIGTAIAQSFSLSLAESCGDIVGDEMERFGIHLWLAPALNIHRSILCGRNFEYFSEDPLVSGLTAAAITRGVQKHPGRGVTIKHFAANNQETNRYNNNSNVSQRALREIYLRGFGLCIRESQPRAVMTSYNLINGTHTSESRALTTDILRGEFGFRGIVMTDWVVGGSLMYNSKRYPMPNAGKVALAGGDLFMPGSRADYNRCLAMLRQGTLPRYQLELNATRVVHMARKLTEEEQKTKE